MAATDKFLFQPGRYFEGDGMYSMPSQEPDKWLNVTTGATTTTPPNPSQVLKDAGTNPSVNGGQIWTDGQGHYWGGYVGDNLNGQSLTPAQLQQAFGNVANSNQAMADKEAAGRKDFDAMSQKAMMAGLAMTLVPAAFAAMGAGAGAGAGAGLADLGAGATSLADSFAMGEGLLGAGGTGAATASQSLAALNAAGAGAELGGFAGGAAGSAPFVPGIGAEALLTGAQPWNYAPMIESGSELVGNAIGSGALNSTAALNAAGLSGAEAAGAAASGLASPFTLPNIPPGTSTVAQELLNPGSSPGVEQALTPAQQTAAENLSYGLNEAGVPLNANGMPIEQGVLDGLAQTAGISTKTLMGLGPTAIGALLGGTLASGKPAGTTTTTQDIQDWLKRYVVGNLNAAQSYMTENPQDNSLLAPATAQLKSTIAGDYLNANPWLDRTFNQAKDAVGAGIDSRFSSAGRYGSGAHQGVLGTTFNNLATNIYGGNYANERTKQLTAATAAPGFTTEAATAPFSAFNAFGNLTKGLGTQTTSPYFTNTAGGALSGALAGYGLSRVFGT